MLRCPPRRFEMTSYMVLWLQLWSHGAKYKPNLPTCPLASAHTELSHLRR